MKRLLLAWGGTALGTIFGLTNAIVVTRQWVDDEAAQFFLIPAVLISLATLAELGQGVLSVHDVARLADDIGRRQAYVNTVLRSALRRGSAAGVVGFFIAYFLIDFGTGLSLVVGLTSVLTTLAVAGQPLLRGLDRRVLAPIGGLIGATIATGTFLIPLRILRPETAPVLAVLAGYSLAGMLTVMILIRPSGGAPVDLKLVRIRRSRFAAAHNIANLAGRQIDILIAGALLSSATFTSYSVTTRLAAPLGLIAYAANQAVAHDMHRIVDGDPGAAEDVRRLYRWASVAAVVSGVIIIALGPTVGDRVFGGSIDVRSEILALIVAGYVVSVLAGSSTMLLAAAERTEYVLRAGVWALCVAGIVAIALVVTDSFDWVAPAFLATWLAVTTVLSAEFTRRQIHLSAWFFDLGATVER